MILTLFAVALILGFLGRDTPLSGALRRQVGEAAARLFSRKTLAALLALVFISLLVREHPWIAMAGMGLGDVAVVFDLAILALLVSTVDVARRAVQHLDWRRPWRIVAGVVRASAPRERRPSKRPQRLQPKSKEDEPAFAYAR
jgi:hypothetical protein